MPETPDTFAVSETLAGERLDRAVALLTGYSRSDVQALIEDGSVQVDGVRVAKSRRLKAGEVVTVSDRPRPAEPPRPEDVDFDVRHEDDHLVVLSKPPGLVVHPGSGNESGTLVNGILRRYPEVAGVGDPMRPGIVHRLDRDTTGLMLVARTTEAYERLVGMLAQRHVSRRYQALVWGVPEPARGSIEAPVGRSRRQPTRMAVTPSGREARTHYEILETFKEPGVTLIEVALDTGRTHQIRVHFAAIGHPVVGDATYGGARERLVLDRPFLHAYRLELDHPTTGNPLKFEEPLPADLVGVLEELRRP